MASLLRTPSKVKEAVFHPELQPILEAYSLLKRVFDLSQVPNSFSNMLCKTVRIEGVLDQSTLYVTSPITKLLLVKKELLSFVNKDSVIIRIGKVDAEDSTEMVQQAWTELLHLIFLTPSSYYVLAQIHSMLNELAPIEIRTTLLGKARITETDIATWAHVKRAAVQRQNQKLKASNVVNTSSASFFVESQIDGSEHQ